MSIDRRHFIGATAATGAFTVTEAVAAPRRAEHRAGLRARRRRHSPRRSLQRPGRPDRGAAARDRPHRAARACRSSSLPASIARAACVLPTGARIVGVPGATRIVATDHAPLIVARGADHILLSGIIFDGSGRNLPANARADPARRRPRHRDPRLRDRRRGPQRHRARSDRRRDHHDHDHGCARRGDPRAQLARAGDRAQHHPRSRRTTAFRCGARRAATTAPR